MYLGFTYTALPVFHLFYCFSPSLPANVLADLHHAWPHSSTRLPCLALVNCFRLNFQKCSLHCEDVLPEEHSDNLPGGTLSPWIVRQGQASVSNFSKRKGALNQPCRLAIAHLGSARHELAWVHLLLTVISSLFPPFTHVSTVHRRKTFRFGRERNL